MINDSKYTQCFSVIQYNRSRKIVKLLILNIIIDHIIIIAYIETVAIFNALYRNDIKFKLKEKRLSIQYIAYYIKTYVKHDI